MEMEEKENLRVILRRGVHDVRNGPVSVVPSMVWERKDTAFLVTGALACLKGVYITALERKKEGQYFSCLLTKEDRESGAWEEKVSRKIEDIVSTAHPAGIIVYASCLEFMASLPMKARAARLEKKWSLPIRILYRGALVSPKYPPMEALPKMMAAIPDTGRPLSPHGAPEVPEGSDFQGAADVLQPLDTYNVLLEGGGCTECYDLPKEEIRRYHLMQTKFSSVEAAKRYKEILPAALTADYRRNGKGRLLCLLSSVIPNELSFDLDWLAAELRRAGVPVLLIPTDGTKGVEAGRQLAEAAVSDWQEKHGMIPKRDGNE